MAPTSHFGVITSTSTPGPGPSADFSSTPPATTPVLQALPVGGRSPSKSFSIELAHTPAPGAARLQIGTPAILSLAPLTGALELFAAAGGIQAVRLRSLALTQRILARAELELRPLGFAIGTPVSEAARGGHVALIHSAAGQICPALRAAGVTPDYRHPDVLRP